MPVDSTANKASSIAKVSLRRAAIVPTEVWVALFIGVMTTLVYWPAVKGKFILDDDLLVTDNHLAQAPDGLYRIWCTTQAADYWPVTNTTLWLEWRLWGAEPTGYHVVNLLLFAIDATLVWVILRELAIPGAFLAALLFALHPVNVESVAWISQLKNVLSMLFFLLSIGAYLQFDKRVRSQHADPSSLVRQRTRQSVVWYVWSLSAFILAMLCKGSVAILPLLLLVIIWWRYERLTQHDFVATAPFFFVAVGLSLVNIWFQTHGSSGTIRNADFLDRLLGSGAVVWFYLSKAIWPFHLVFVYPQWQIQAGDWHWWLPLVAFLIVTLMLWSLRRWKWVRPVFCAWCFYCIALLPVMGFVDVGYMKFTLVADHYQYIALLAVVTLIGSGISLLWNKASHFGRVATGAGITFILTMFAFLAWQQSRLYAGPLPLYSDTLHNNPRCWLAHNNLASAYNDLDQPQAAIEQCRQALSIKSDDAEARYNMGCALGKLKRPNEAIEQYQLALQLKPAYPQAHNNLAAIYNQQGRSQEAADECRLALRTDPYYADAENNLAIALNALGNPAEALQHYNSSLQLNPNYPDAEINLGNALVRSGKPKEAIQHYEQAVRLKPNYGKAHDNLAVALAMIGRLPDAIKQYELALKLNPDDVDAYANMALAYAALGKRESAISAGEKALALAHSQNETALALQIDAWLRNYRN